MPGIFGFLSKSGEVDKAEAQNTIGRMSSLLKHQTWYGQEQLVTEFGAFGAMSVGNSSLLKKVAFRGDEYLVLIDGYVYSFGHENHHERDELPAKILNHVFSKNGDYTGIKGNYNICIVNLREKGLLLFNDRMAPRRIYVYEDSQRIYFSPEIKGISFLGDFLREIDFEAVADFLNYGYLLGEKTFFQGIRSPLSASVLSYQCKDRESTTVRYARPVYDDSNESFDKYVERGAHLIERSVSEKLEQASSVICPISGGLDSRLIISALTGVNRGMPVLPVTYGQKFSYEYINGKKVCDKLGYKNHQLVTISPEKLIDKYRKAVWLSEGMIHMLNSHLLLLPDEVGGDYSSLLNGIYGGPTNYGAEYYRREHIECDLDFDSKVLDILKVLSLNPRPYQEIVTDLGPVIADRAFLSISDELEEHLGVSERFCDQRDSFFIENRMRRCINQSALYRFFWEEHLPLSNYDVYDFYLSVSPEHKLEKRLLKGMIKKKYPEMARIQDANTGLDLYQERTRLYDMKEKTKRKIKYYVNKFGRGKVPLYNKTTYAHYDVWFRNNIETNMYFRSSLLNSSIVEDGVYDSDRLSVFFDDVEKTSLNFHHLVRLTTLSIWYEHFFKMNDIEELKDTVRLDDFSLG